MEREMGGNGPAGWPESIQACQTYPAAHDIGGFEVRRALPADERPVHLL